MNDELRDAWSGWLQKFRWDYFLTITFRTPRQANHALSSINQAGKIIRRHTRGRFFLGTELHISRALHMHGLLQSPGEPTKSVADALWRDFYKTFGRSQVHKVQSNESVARYVTKYVTKELTEWDISI